MPKDKKRILVTGVAGFLGSHLSEKLVELGHSVIGIDNMIGGYEDNVPKNIQFYKGDAFPEWQGDLLVASLNGQSLIRLDIENDKIIAKEIIFKDKIGRIRDFKIDFDGNIYLISDSSKSYVWKLSKTF